MIMRSIAPRRWPRISEEPCARILKAAVVAFALTGLAIGAAQAQQPKSGGTLVYATGTDVQTLDPQFVTDVPTSRIVMHIHETLVKPDEQGNIQPALATVVEHVG